MYLRNKNKYINMANFAKFQEKQTTELMVATAVLTFMLTTLVYGSIIVSLM